MLAVWFLMGPALLSPHKRLTCDAESEAIGHLWGLRTTTEGLFEHGPFMRVSQDINYPEGYRDHLMDPINIALFAPIYFATGSGPRAMALAWNGVHLGFMVLACLGCWLLGRRFVRRQPARMWAPAILIAGFCTAPYLMGYPWSGRTENLSVLLLPLHMEMLLRATLDNPKKFKPWPLVAAGLLLGAIALGGLYATFFVALFELPLALFILWRLPPQVALGRLALVAGICIALNLPTLYSFLCQSSHSDSAFNVKLSTIDPIPSCPIYEILIPGGLLGHRVGFHIKAGPYIGVVWLIPVLIALVRFRSRRVLGWCLLAVWLLLFSVGEYLSFHHVLREAPRAIPGPLHLVRLLLPTMGLMNQPDRIAQFAALPMAVATTVAFAHLTKKRSTALCAGLGLLLVTGILIDHTTFAPRRPLNAPWFDAESPAGLTESVRGLPSGAVVLLPLDRNYGLVTRPHAQFLVWQPELGRPVSSATNRRVDSTLAWSRFFQAVTSEQGRIVLAGRETGPVDSMEDLPRIAGRDLRELRRQGFSGVVLDMTADESAELYQFLASCIGEATTQTDDVATWDLVRMGVEPSTEPLRSGRPPEDLGLISGEYAR